MALSQITDLSGNITKFIQGDQWTAPNTYSQIAGTTLNGYYDDPTSEINVLTPPKTFAYYGGNRIMQSVVDENGNKTWYDIDALGRRTTEKLYDPQGNLDQETDFAYDNPSYPGFMTQKTVKALGTDSSGNAEPSWTQSLITQFVRTGMVVSPRKSSIRVA